MLAMTAFALTPAKAVNANYAAGNLVLYFQQYGGPAIPFMIDLGPATAYRDATANILNIANVVSGPSSVANGSLTGSSSGSPTGGGFAANWFDDPTVYCGLAAVRSNSSGTTTQVNGDPSRTIYVSAARPAVGTQSNAWSISTGTMTTAATNIGQMANRLGSIPASNTDRLLEGTSTSFVDNQNPPFGTGQGTAYATFAGGVQSNFGTGTFGTLGGVAAESALDLYRILATTNPSGTVISEGVTNPGDGSYEGTFVIDNTGSVSFIAPVPEPATFTLLAASAVLGLTRRRRTRHA